MSSCLARAVFCASSRSTPASTTSLGHTRASGRNSLCLECPRLRVVSWHSLSSVACITTTGGWPDTHGVVWIEKVASTVVDIAGISGYYVLLAMEDEHVSLSTAGGRQEAPAVP